MFEKEAEEIVKRNVCGDCNKCQSHGYIGCDIYRYSKDSCLYGLRKGYNKAKEWYCNSKPNPYMPYEYCSTQLKSATENDDLVHVPVGGTIRAELYNIIKDKLEHGGIEYHECDSTRIDKKEYETLYNVIGHKYDDLGDNAEVSDFRLPNANGWYIRIK